LKETRKIVSEIYPVIISKKTGEVADGNQRLKAHPKWRKEYRDLTDVQVAIIGLVANSVRRPATRKDYDKCAMRLLKSEGVGDKPYRLKKSGKAIAERISELSGIPYSTIKNNISDRFKQSQNKLPASVTFPETTEIRVPIEYAGSVKSHVDAVKNAVKAKPELKREIVKSTKSDLRKLTNELDAAKTLPKHLREYVERGKLSLEIARVIARKVPKKFIPQATAYISEKKMKLLDAQAYLASQAPWYAIHEKTKADESGESKSTSEPSEPIRYMKLYGFDLLGKVMDVNDSEAQLQTEDSTIGVFKELEQVIQQLRSKMSQNDLLTVHIRLETPMKKKEKVEA
jgi:hypothetical protein